VAALAEGDPPAPAAAYERVTAGWRALQGLRAAS